MKRLLPLVALLAASREGVRADEVKLRNGARLEGVVREEGGSVRIEMDSGTITLKKSDVASISHGALPLKEFEERLAKTRDMGSKLELGRWAEVHGLPGRSRQVYEEILAQDPNQSEARKALGYTYRDGRWLDPDELKAAQGLVQVDGRWVTPEERARLEASELELRRSVIRLEREEEALARQREADAARIARERAQAEYLRAAVQSTQGTSWVPVPWGTMPWSPYRYPFYTGYPPGASPPPPLTGP